MRVLIDPEHSEGGQVVLANGQLCRVGRCAPAELVCSSDPFLSGLHFVIDCSNGECRVRDLASRNGTYRNGYRISDSILADGDLISAGNTHFRVRIEHNTPEFSALPRLDEAGLTQDAKAVLEALRGIPERLFALLDAARDDHILDLLRRSGEKYQSLYEGPQGKDLDDWAPHLAEVPKDSRLLLWLIHEGWGKSWGVYLACSQTFAEIRRHLRKFLLVRTEDRQDLYFRFYDPRVLRTFLSACAPDEATSFWGPVNRYLLEGQRSELLQFSNHTAAGASVPTHAGLQSH